MEILIISFVAFLTAILTFFSGFGLGTILLPAFMLFFPVEIAIALTGIVHFTNNVFKIFLVQKSINREVLLKFGLPAIIFSFLGAWVLFQISYLPSVYSYNLFSNEFTITPIKLTIAIILLVFSILEMIPSLRKIEFSRDKLFIGGILSGFFGGLSGIQGAIRSAFLIKSGLTKESYIATGVAIACLIDFSRLSVYTGNLLNINIYENLTIIIFAVLAAILGSLLGNKFLKKITLNFIHNVVAILLILISIGLGSGLL